MASGWIATWGDVRLVLAYRVEGWRLAAGFGEPRAVVVAGVERGVLVPFGELGQVVDEHASGAGVVPLCEDLVPALLDARCGFAQQRADGDRCRDQAVEVDPHRELCFGQVRDRGPGGDGAAGPEDGGVAQVVAAALVAVEDVEVHRRGSLSGRTLSCSAVRA